MPDTLTDAQLLEAAQDPRYRDRLETVLTSEELRRLTRLRGSARTWTDTAVEALPLAGGVVGRKSGEGFYRYEDGKARMYHRVKPFYRPRPNSVRDSKVIAAADEALADDGQADGGDGASGDGGPLTSPVIQYAIVFENEEQQARWFAFVRWLKANDKENDTLAGRLDAYLGTLPFADN